MEDIEALSNVEKKAIEELKKRIEHELTPALLKDQSLYYRFLKARDFNVNDAESLLRKNISLREFYRTEELLKSYEPPDGLEEYYNFSFVGFDKEGCVIRYAVFGNADTYGLINSFTATELIQYTISLIEEDVARLEEQSKKLGKMVTKFTYILDFENFSFSQATHKKGLEAMYLGLELFQDSYPERIKAFYMINANFYFNVAFSFLKSVMSSVLLKKTEIFGNDGYKEVLLKIIDENVLPAFLGGNRTDPDGNPLCKTFIHHGKKVPETYYLKNRKPSLEMSGFKKLKINRSSSSEVEIDIKQESLIEWTFHTETRDLGFALFYRANSKSPASFEELIPTERIQSTTTGRLHCNKIGTYVFVFDNSCSWLRSKELCYRIDVGKMNEDKI